MQNIVPVESHAHVVLGRDPLGDLNLQEQTHFKTKWFSRCLGFSGSWRNGHLWLLFCANYLECMQVCDDVTHIVYLCIFKRDF